MSMNLYYFNILRARAEPIKFLYHYAKLDVKENLFPVNDWPAIKTSEKCPLRQVPVLEVNGKYYPQTKAILKYLALKADLIPKDPELHLLSDSVVETLEDVWKSNKIVILESLEKVPELFKEINEKWNRAKDFLSNSLSSEGYIGGAKPCHADFLLFHVLDQLYTLKPTLDVPSNLATFREKMADLPGIKEYLTSRGPLPDERIKILKDANL